MFPARFMRKGQQKQMTSFQQAALQCHKGDHLENYLAMRAFCNLLELQLIQLSHHLERLGSKHAKVEVLENDIKKVRVVAWS